MMTDAEYADVLARFASKFRGAAERILPDADDAADAVASATWKGYCHRDQCNRAPDRWLWRIVRNESITMLRQQKMLRRQVRVEVVPLESVNIALDEAPEPLLDEAERAVVRSALSTLTPAQRDVVVRFYWKRQSTPEIARALGEKPITIRMRLMRARERLRPVLRVQLAATTIR